MKIYVADFMMNLLFFHIIFQQFMLFLCFTLAKEIYMQKENDTHSIQLYYSKNSLLSGKQIFIFSIVHCKLYHWNSIHNSTVVSEIIAIYSSDILKYYIFSLPHIHTFSSHPDTCSPPFPSLLLSLPPTLLPSFLCPLFLRWI